MGRIYLFGVIGSCIGGALAIGMVMLFRNPETVGIASGSIGFLFGVSGAQRGVEWGAQRYGIRLKEPV